MDFLIYGFHNLLCLTIFTFLSLTSSTLARNQPTKHFPNSNSSAQINSNSVLVALLDSQYTELSELIEKAMLLQTLEEAVTNHNITIFAPKNEALERELDPEFKQFLLEPRNLNSLQNLILYHMIPTRIDSEYWAKIFNKTTHHSSLYHQATEEEKLKITHQNGVKLVSQARIIRPNDIIRPDGIIQGINQVLIPKTVQQAFNMRRSLQSISAILPQGAPEIDPRTNKFKKPPSLSSPPPPGSSPLLPIYSAMAPGPSLAPAPAPGPGGPHHHFDGEAQVKDFIQTLLHYGGYNELADILVNLTSLASEMGRLVSEGYVLTVLAPNDEAMAKLSTDQLSEPGAPEQIVYYHLIPEYQTEESMYNAVRRFGKVKYDTLRLPHKVAAEEADGSVKFGQGENTAYLFDPDIYTDGRISVQGIDGILFPVEELGGAKTSSPVAKPRRGKLLETTCKMLGALGQDTYFRSCH
ncbi:hypothetical protein LIER_27328 [Lithospermum erythrorhizon]|uniref:FAS1 domain-containing protein n=1 Tax=Lithospermum erythrorhizon TaxID=34254 RepID=A0AAV3RF76_LITER